MASGLGSHSAPEGFPWDSKWDSRCPNLISEIYAYVKVKYSSSETSESDDSIGDISSQQLDIHAERPLQAIQALGHDGRPYIEAIIASIPAVLIIFKMIGSTI